MIKKTNVKLKGRWAQLQRHYTRNWIWFWLSVLTGYLRFFLQGQEHLLDNAPSFLMVNRLMDNMAWQRVLLIICISGIVISLCDIKVFKIKWIYIGCLTFVWVLFLMVFIQIDISIGQHSIGAGLTAFLVLIIFHYAKGNNEK